MLALALGGIPIALLIPAAFSDMRTRIVKKNRWLTASTLIAAMLVVVEVLTQKISVPTAVLGAGIGYLWATIMLIVALSQGSTGKPALGGADIRLLFGPVPLIVAALGYSGPVWLMGVLTFGQVAGFIWWKYISKKTVSTSGYPLVAAMGYSGIVIFGILLVLAMLGINA